MKKMFYLAATAAVAGVMITGCGSSKQMSSAVGAREIKHNACEEYFMQSPATRAVGKGTYFEESAALEMAELDARARFARAIATATTSAARTERLGMSQYSGDAKSGNKVSDQGSKMNTLAEGIAQALISNTVVVKMTKFLLPNEQFEVWVCLEYQQGVEVLSQNIAKKVQQQISDDDKMKMNFEFEQYRKSVKAELENNRNN